MYCMTEYHYLFGTVNNGDGSREIICLGEDRKGGRGIDRDGSHRGDPVRVQGCAYAKVTCGIY